MQNLGKGIYGLAEAARLTGVAPVTARRWFLGRTDHPKSGPVLHPDYPDVGSRIAVSFLDLVDLLMVGRFREERVPLQSVRKVYAVLRDRLSTPHPFGHNRLYTDGATIFLQTINAVGDEHLEELLTRQGAFPKLLRQYLREIDFDSETLIARRWNVAKGIVIDPDRSFGKPIVAKRGISTWALARAFEANKGDAELVADLYETTAEDVRRAVEFENRRVRRMISFFFDLNLSQAMARLVESFDKKNRVRHLDDEFAERTPDTEWLANSERNHRRP